MAFIFIYKELKFQKPENLSEKEYLNFKKGILPENHLPPYLTFQLTNFIVLLIAGIIFIISHLLLDDIKDLSHYNIITAISGIVLLLWIIKIIIETLKYFLYKRRLKVFENQLKKIIENCNDYSEFYFKYKNEIKTTTFGKLLIKLFLKNNYDSYSTIDYNMFMIKEKSREYLRTKEMEESEILLWIISNGIIKDIAIDILNTLKKEIEKEIILKEKKKKITHMCISIFIFLVGVLLIKEQLNNYTGWGLILFGLIRIYRRTFIH